MDAQTLKLLKIMSNKDTSETFSASTDSLEAIRDYIETVVMDIQGLVYYGEITAVVAATSLTADGLSGYGTNFFAPSDGDMWTIYVVEADGAAPSGEYQKCTGYTTASGLFTYGAAFSAEPVVGDKVMLLHPHIAGVLPKLDLIQGGTETIQGLGDEMDAMLDIARTDSGTITFDTAGSEETLYEETDTTPFMYAGSWIDFTSANAGAGEDTEIKLYVKIESGGTYRQVWSATYLSVAVPSPACVQIPNPDDGEAIRVPFYNVYGVKLTATQAAQGGGWNSLDHEHFDAKRGS